MAINDRVADAVAGRQIDLIRLANGKARELLNGPVSRADERLLAAILSVDPANATPLARQRLVERITKILGPQDTAIRLAAVALTDEVAAAEVTFMGDLFARTFGRVGITPKRASEKAAAILARQRPMRGAKLVQWITTLARNDRQRVLAQVNAGALDGQTAKQIGRSMLQGARQVTRRSVTTLVQTATTHTSTVAMELNSARNEDLITVERWLARLDGKTSTICQALDGRVFPVGEGIHPPAHPNCRSRRMPIIPGLTALPVPDEERAVLPTSILEDFDGKPPTVLTYERWLRGRSVAFQHDVLGQTKWKLWSEGGVSLDRFTNDVNRVLTIPELRRRMPGIFAEVGL